MKTMKLCGNTVTLFLLFLNLFPARSALRRQFRTNQSKQADA